MKWIDLLWKRALKEKAAHHVKNKVTDICQSGKCKKEISKKERCGTSANHSESHYWQIEKTWIAGTFLPSQPTQITPRVPDAFLSFSDRSDRLE